MTSHDESDGHARKSETSLHATAQEVQHIDSDAVQIDVVVPNKQLESQTEVSTSVERIPTNDRPYSSFTSRQKAIIVLVATLGGSFSPFSTFIYFPAIDTISHALGVSVSDVNLTITTYMIFQGISPSFTSAIADDYGRRPAYMIGFTIYLFANLGLALNKSYAGLLVLRCVQSAGSSGLVTLMQGTMADIVTSAERGKYIAITSLASILAPSLAPILGGVLAQHLGWHSVFWFLLILGGVYFVPLALFFPETCRSVVGDGSIEPPKWNRCLTNLSKQQKKSEGESGSEKGTPPEYKPEKEKPSSRRRKWDVFGSLTIVGDPETAILLLYMGIIYAGFYIVSTSLTVQFHIIYGLSSTLQGLLFIPQVVGTILATITNTRLLDRNFKRHALKAGLEVDRKKQGDLIKMPIEQARLEIGMPFFAFGAVFIVVYGWLLEKRVHIAGPIIMLGAIGYTTMVGFNTISVLIIDLHRKRAATASAASNLVRCLLGAGASAVANPMIEAIGNGWTHTLVGLVELATLPLLMVTMRVGMKWRAKKREDGEKEREQTV
ncbi:putative MFS transporter [Fonsecaea pedrosoi]|nr:putative MFS transporter [Fonsecaea pedrosoi]